MTLRDQINHLRETARDNGLAAKASWESGNDDLANYHDGQQTAFYLCAGWLEEMLPHINHLRQTAKDNGLEAVAQWNKGNADAAHYHDGLQSAFSLCADWILVACALGRATPVMPGCLVRPFC
jgi:hypothetical protein